MPGTLVHALAYESMAQERMLRRLPLAAATFIGLILGLVFFALFSAASWRRGAAILLVAIAVLYFATLAVQVWTPTLVDTGFWLFCLVAAYLAAMARRIDRQAYQIFIQSMAYQHRRDMTDAVLSNDFHGIVVTDSKERVQLFNNAAVNMFSCQRVDAIRRPFVEIVP